MRKKKEFYLVMCKCRLIAEVMKDCPICHFNVGLVEQLRVVEPTPVLLAARASMLVLSE